MYIVAIAWIYVVLMMAVAEALSPQGRVLGAVITFVLYGVLPLAIVLYVMATPHRRRARRAAETAELARLAGLAEPAALAAVGARPAAPASAGLPPDGGGEAAGDAVAPVGKEA